MLIIMTPTSIIKWGKARFEQRGRVIPSRSCHAARTWSVSSYGGGRARVLQILTMRRTNLGGSEQPKSLDVKH